MKKWPHTTFPHTQIIYFDNGASRVVRHIKEIESGNWTHLICDDDHGASEIIVNPSRVLFIRIKGEK